MKNLKYYISAPKYKFLYRNFGNMPFSLLDIGAGNHSATKFTDKFPNCEYHGVDIDMYYNNSESDFQRMKAFYEMDLTQLQFEKIPNHYFDAIIIAHVIEHLYNGELVLQGLMKKLKPGGKIYVEFPSTHSAHLPHMSGTLNFFDDSTHVRFYNPYSIANLFMSEGHRVTRVGRRRDWWLIILMPLKIVHDLIRHGRIYANSFWDLLGFADQVIATHKENNTSI